MPDRKMELIDTHAHIYLSEFAGRQQELLAMAAAQGIQQVLLPAIDTQTHGALLELEAAWPQCRAMMGLHPCSVTATVETELAAVRDWLDQRPFIAVGEIGLDFYWDTTFAEQQYTAFHRQIEWALEKGLPISIHSRNATDECIAVVQQYPGLRGVFHCFSGTVIQAEKIIEAGLLLGIGGVVTFKNAGLDAVVAARGLDHLVLETDAPYLAPVPYRGKENVPAYLRLVAEKVATVTGQPLEAVASITTQNAIKLFGLS